MNFKNIKSTIILFIFLILSIYLYIELRFISAPEEIKSIFSKNIETLISFFPRLILLIILFIAVKIFLRITINLINKHFPKKAEHDINTLTSIYRYIIWILAMLLGISILYSNFGSLITSIGLIGFGITFALQKPILNFVGWISIIFNKPFVIGDRISINGLQGEVYDIKLMYIALKEINTENQFSGKAVTIPNELILTGAIINDTKGSPYVWNTISIGIAYESNWKKAAKILQEIGEKVSGELIKKIEKEWKEVNTGKSRKIENKPAVNIDLSQSSIDLKLRYLCDVANKRETMNEINTSVLEQFKKEDIEIAYPHLKIKK